MRNKAVMVMVVLMLALSVVLPAGAKGPDDGNAELLKRWEERGIFDRLEKMKKNPNAALSKVEFSGLIHTLIGYGNEEMTWKPADVVKQAKEIGYWDEVYGEGAEDGVAVTKEEAVSTLQYVFPGSTISVDDGAEPLKLADAFRLFNERAEGYFNNAGEYTGEDIEGNALISHGGVMLKDIKINGDLYITGGAVGETVTLDTVTVSGKVFVADEVQNDVHSVNSTLGQVAVYGVGTTESDWSLVWSDEFINNVVDPEKWTYDIGNWIVDEEGNGISPGWGNNELEYYTDSSKNSFIRDGKLVIKAKKERRAITDQYGSYNYSSAKLKTKGLFSKKYGKFEARMKLPEGQGLWPAFWMMPEDSVYGNWPTSGEIDIMENAGRDTGTIGGTVHYGEEYPNNTYTGAEYHFPEGQDTTGFHTYGIEWEPGEIRWYVDGELYQTLNDWFTKGTNQADKYAFPAPFDQEFYIILNLAVGGWYGGDPDRTTPFPGEMEVDYVRVYELTGRDYMDPVEPAQVKEELPEGAKFPQADGNYIYDQAYSEPFTVVDAPEDVLDPLYWNFVTLPDFGGSGTMTKEVIDGVPYAKTTVTNPGNALWALQQIQNVSIAKGGTYKVSFDAKSNIDRTIMSKVSGGAERGYANYSGEQTMQLTSTVQTYEYTFTHRQDTDIAARLEINMGAKGNAPVWIGNVRVEEVEPIDPEGTSKTPLGDGNHVYNGTFDQGDMTRLKYWDVAVNAPAEATAEVSEEDRELHVAITNGGANANDVHLKQGGLMLVDGASYELTFDGRASNERPIEIDILSEDGTVSYSDEVTVNLDGEMTNHKVSFKMLEGQSDDFGQLVFKLGGTNGDVVLDNVRLMKTSLDVEVEPLINGDFTLGLDLWSSYIHFDANASVTGENEQMNVHIINAGNEAWSVLAEQANMKLGQGLTYELSFDAKSTVARNIEVTLENTGYFRYFNKVFAVDDVMKNYSYEFQMEANDIVSLKFLMGQFAGVHDITIDNVVLRVKDVGVSN
ncbi:carbohydrate binding domain-containing protein [Rossellomorea aquimaris]|uniref:carbohydrate binding domain-containing protein n=1 Tax=Rossellomorea aquimaris TaxID=189382 RepID=UPI001CD3B9CF|nr:carbohydrate binding domain-containing protein [Rossellomorea aquimaris]MCA1054055.1 carbohydrate binding domain-containing protein [Rossellomorea aquimaris]